MTERISNKNCRGAVAGRLDFQGSNLFAENLTDDVYVVYSYGKHWPLFACIKGKWYANTEGSSPSTARQRTYAHPHVPTVDGDCATLKRLISDATGGRY